jgi:CRP-like cAMP-binding protein
MQNKFYLNCRLEEHTKNKVLVVQERRPLQFYVLLKGTLVCTFRKKGDNKSNTICFIEKGNTFGDLPLLSNSNHTCSVISKTGKNVLTARIGVKESFRLSDP